MPAKIRLMKIETLIFAAITSRKLWSTARLKPAPDTAGVIFSSEASSTSWAWSMRSSALLATSPSRIIWCSALISIYADRPMMSSTRPVTWTRRVGRCPSSTSSDTSSPGVTPSTLASVSESTTPDGGMRISRPSRSTMRLKRGFGETPVIAK